MFTIEKRAEGSRLTVVVSGKLNTVTSQQFDAELSDLSGITELILDFSELESISSAGLRVLLAVQCTMNEQGKMVVTHVNEAVGKVFLLTGFTRFLTIE